MIEYIGVQHKSERVAGSFKVTREFVEFVLKLDPNSNNSFVQLHLNDGSSYRVRDLDDLDKLQLNDFRKFEKFVVYSNGPAIFLEIQFTIDKNPVNVYVQAGEQSDNILNQINTELDKCRMWYAPLYEDVARKIVNFASICLLAFILFGGGFYSESAAIYLFISFMFLIGLPLFYERIFDSLLFGFGGGLSYEKRKIEFRRIFGGIIVAIVIAAGGWFFVS